MASGHVNRTKRPNTLAAPTSLRVKKVLANWSRPHMAPLVGRPSANPLGFGDISVPGQDRMDNLLKFAASSQCGVASCSKRTRRRR